MWTNTVRCSAMACGNWWADERCYWLRRSERLRLYRHGMIKVRRQWLGGLLGAALALPFVACGSPGPPEPPSLELPRVVTDLRATRKGDKVTLVWTVPTNTTD